jgi:hypothetical protein
MIESNIYDPTSNSTEQKYEGATEMIGHGSGFTVPSGTPTVRGPVR